MAKKRETLDTQKFLHELKQVGYFRKISDPVQEGFPDIWGCLDGIFVALEMKSIEEVPPDGMVPPLKGHRFSPTQIRELKNIYEKGGLGLAVVICGPYAYLSLPHEISERGQIHWDTKAARVVCRKNGAWEMNIFKEIVRGFQIDHCRK